MHNGLSDVMVNATFYLLDMLCYVMSSAIHSQYTSNHYVVAVVLRSSTKELNQWDMLLQLF